MQKKNRNQFGRTIAEQKWPRIIKNGVKCKLYELYIYIYIYA